MRVTAVTYPASAEEWNPKPSETGMPVMPSLPDPLPRRPLRQLGEGVAPRHFDPLGCLVDVGTAEGGGRLREPRPHSRPLADAAGRAGSAHVKSGCMCAVASFGRARPRLRMPLSGLGLYHGLRGCCTAPEPEAVTGATPLWRCPVRASRRVGMCTSRTPSPEGRSRPSVPCGKAIEAAFRGRLRNRNVGVSVTAGAKGPPGHCWTAKAPPANRVVTVTPAAPTDGWTANACSAASKRRSTPFPEGSLVRERPVEARGRGCENTLGPTPHRALGEAGRSRHGPCGPCATGHRVAKAARQCRFGGKPSASV